MHAFGLVIFISHLKAIIFVWTQVGHSKTKKVTSCFVSMSKIQRCCSKVISITCCFLKWKERKQTIYHIFHPHLTPSPTFTPFKDMNTFLKTRFKLFSREFEKKCYKCASINAIHSYTHATFSPSILISFESGFRYIHAWFITQAPLCDVRTSATKGINRRKTRLMLISSLFIFWWLVSASGFRSSRTKWFVSPTSLSWSSFAR